MVPNSHKDDKNNNFYNIFDDSIVPDPGSELEHGDNHAHSNVFPNAFDSMLEILPDDINFDSFFTPVPDEHDEDDDMNRISDNNSRTTLTKGSDRINHDHFKQDLVENISSSPTSVKYENIFHQVAQQQELPLLSKKPIWTNGTKPIDIINQQNGEIAGLWDFNIDNFQMTPNNSSDSATISAPNSYNSESFQNSSNFTNFANNNMNQFKNVTNHALNQKGSLYSNSYSNQIAESSNNNHTFNIYNIPSGTSTQNFSSSPSVMSNINNINLKNGTMYKQQISRKSSLTNDKGIAIPLSSSNTNNSIRKTPMTRQLSSNSLTNLNKRPSSISDLSTSANNSSILNRKPQIQCFNCKTFKTPLWRRDPNGNTLCNACGLFQKLHGTMRPLSLKSDVIKKRNTKKRTKKNQQLQQQQQQQQQSTTSISSMNSVEPPSMFANNQDPHISKNFVPLSISSAIATTAMTSTAAQSNIPKARSRNSFTNLAASGSMKLMDDFSDPSNSRFNLFGNRNNSGRDSVSPCLSSANLSQFNNNGNSINQFKQKNRRNSTSSNSSSRSSSSRSMIPILPKPSSSSGLPNIQTASSNNNSTTSSPRVASSSYQCASNSPLQHGLFSSSMGRNSISIPRRKPSRNTSHSSSFMAASLQQLQQQNSSMKQSVQQESMRHISNQESKYNQQRNGSYISQSPINQDYYMIDNYNNGNNQKVGSHMQSYSVKDDKSHTSLLSQQLQDSNTHRSNEDTTASNNFVYTDNNEIYRKPMEEEGTKLDNVNSNKDENSAAVAANELDWLKFGI